MKILQFVHKVDIDGMGGVILSFIAFGKNNVKYELCMPKTINNIIQKYIDSGEIYEFDYIYITDICPEEPMLSILDEDEKLKGKIFVLDHHMDNVADFKKRYTWVNENDGAVNKKSCGTQLYYTHLLVKHYIQYNELVASFVEQVRQYDTWEWKDKYDNEEANSLSQYFDAMGSEIFIEDMYQRLLTETEGEFHLTKIQQMVVNREREKIREYLDEVFKNVVIKEIDGIKTAILFAERYKNEMKAEARRRNLDVDAVIMLKLDAATISFRSTNQIEVLPLAKKCGGGGIPLAAGAEVSREQYKKLVDAIF